MIRRLTPSGLMSFRRAFLRFTDYGRSAAARGGLDESGQLDSYLTMYIPPGSSDELAPGQFERIAKALADPRRFALLETIAAAKHECPYQRLCDEFPVTKATISHHLRELVHAGLVATERDGQFVHTRVTPGVIEAYAAELVRRAAGESAAR